MCNIAVKWKKQISFCLASPCSFHIGILEKKNLHIIRHFYKSQFRIENYLDEQ